MTNEELRQEYLKRFEDVIIEEPVPNVDGSPVKKPTTKAVYVKKFGMDKLEKFIKEIKSKDAKEGEIVGLITRYGGTGGLENKQWLLDQTMRIILGDKYQNWRNVYNNFFDNGEGYEFWDEGIEG